MKLDLYACAQACYGPDAAPLIERTRAFHAEQSYALLSDLIEALRNAPAVPTAAAIYDALATNDDAALGAQIRALYARAAAPDDRQQHIDLSL